MRLPLITYTVDAVVRFVYVPNVSVLDNSA